MMWWGNKDSERFELPKPVEVKDDYDMDMTRDQLFMSPSNNVELHMIESSALISLGCSRICDKEDCSRICRGAIAMYQEDYLKCVTFTCAMHICISRCIHEKLSFNLSFSRKYKVYFDFSINRGKGKVLIYIIENRSPSVDNNVRDLIRYPRNSTDEHFNRNLTLDTLMKCRVIKSL